MRLGVFIGKKKKFYVLFDFYETY